MTLVTVISVSAVLLVGVLLGALIGFLYARSRQAAAAAELTGQVRAAEERARAALDRAELTDGQLGQRFEALSRRRRWTPAPAGSSRWPRAG